MEQCYDIHELVFHPQKTFIFVQQVRKKSLHVGTLLTFLFVLNTMAKESLYTTLNEKKN